MMLLYSTFTKRSSVHNKTMIRRTTRCLESHDLFHEFPEYKDRIAELKAADSRFAELYDEYHVVNGEVERIELQSRHPRTSTRKTSKSKGCI